MKKLLFLLVLPFVAVSSLAANSEELQQVKQASNIEDKLMYEEFKSIVRFNPLHFSSNSHKLLDDSKKELEKISKTLKKSQKAQSEMIVVIVGFTKTIETNNERVIRESTFSYKDLFFNTSKEKLDKVALKEAKTVAKYLIDEGISKDIIVVESRKRDEKLFTEGTNKGKELNYRVMVTLYEPI